MSKSRNSKRRDYEDDEVKPKNEHRKFATRRKEKRLTTAIKSRNLNMLKQLEEDFEWKAENETT